MSHYCYMISEWMSWFSIVFDIETVTSASLFIPLPGGTEWLCALHLTKHEYLWGMNLHNLIWSNGRVFNHTDLFKNTEFVQICARSTTISSGYHTKISISDITLHPLDPIREAFY